jgi:glycolate oxidase FAD binding subunit
VAESWKAETDAAVVAAVRSAVAEDLSLELVGRGSKRGFGRPVEADVELDLSGLSGVIDYQPEELVVTVRPGTPMAELEALLASRNQLLAFEAPDFGGLWDGVGRGTIGGAVLVGQGGSRRLSAGAPRDHLLGLKAVNGFGEAFGAGGRVVKNVTGFDLPRLVAGSFGALCAVTELTLRASPAPEDSATLALLGLDDAQGIAQLCAGLGTPAQVSSAAHLPADVVADTPAAGLVAAGTALTLLRLEGVTPSVQARLAHLQGALEAAAPTLVVDREASFALWKALSDAAPFTRAGDQVVWKLSVAPTDGPRIGRALADELGGRCFYNWGGGEVWLEAPFTEDAHAQVVRSRLAAVGPGHATLMRAPSATRVAVPTFQPLGAGEEALTRRIKAQFDPKGLFNPGRMYGGV